MKRYLLFNSGCGACSGIAGQVEKETDGILVPRSLAELEIQQLLNDSLPDWEWEPMLMEVSDSKEVKVYTGVMMRLRLIQLLGISKAARVASIVHQSLQPLAPVQERRTFLRYSGSLLAGLAVLGLKPMRAAAQMTLENPDSGSTISGRHLSGAELRSAVTEAVAVGDYGVLRQHLLSRGYSENQGQVTGIQVDETGFQPIVYVTIPYQTPAGGAAQVKYTREGSDVEIVMGVFNGPGSTVSSIDVHEVISGRAVHTRTFNFSPDGTVSSTEVGDPPSDEEVLSGAADFDVQFDRCAWCKKLCKGIRKIGCKKGAVFICAGLCATFTGGVSLAACILLCKLMVTTLCKRLSTGTCDWICADVLNVC